MVIYKAVRDLLWTLWGLIQLANAIPADGFCAHADTLFARWKALMAGRDFPATSLRSGPDPVPPPDFFFSVNL
jgi:hypothetical protein